MAITPYLVLARKYRPQKLYDLIGQEILTQTLKNAIESKRIHHAFLLTGTRGVGKTTTARILALSFNCTGTEQNRHTFATVDPCLECSNCRQIIDGNHPDIIEFDAASKTGVDSIREVIDSCMYPPMQARYKIYIVDEVHMLSKSAFNALLKTLEEPPENIKFIFATTEIKKIPVTILSRCQSFYLKNLDLATLTIHMQNICQKENYQIDEAAAKMIAKSAEGSVRDALSLLDQVIINAENHSITLEGAKKIMPFNDVISICRLFEDIINKDLKSALTIIKIINSNNTINSYIIKDIMELTSLAAKLIMLDDELFLKDDNADMIAVILKVKSSLSLPLLIRLWQILLKSIEEIKVADHSCYLEMLIIKLIYTTSLPTPGEILTTVANQANDFLNFSAGLNK